MNCWFSYPLCFLPDAHDVLECGLSCPSRHQGDSRLGGKALICSIGVGVYLDPVLLENKSKGSPIDATEIRRLRSDMATSVIERDFLWGKLDRSSNHAFKDEKATLLVVHDVSSGVA